MNWVIGKKQKRRNRIKAQFGKNPMELEAWESLEKRMREIRMYEELVVQDVKKEEWQSAGSLFPKDCRGWRRSKYRNKRGVL